MEEENDCVELTKIEDNENEIIERNIKDEEISENVEENPKEKWSNKYDYYFALMANTISLKTFFYLTIFEGFGKSY